MGVKLVLCVLFKCGSFIFHFYFGNVEYLEANSKQQSYSHKNVYCIEYFVVVSFYRFLMGILPFQMEK